MPLGAACYLLESDLSQLLGSAGPTLAAFVVGAVGTLAGTLVAFWLVGPRLGPDGWKVASALCASYIGGEHGIQRPRCSRAGVQTALQKNLLHRLRRRACRGLERRERLCCFGSLSKSNVPDLHAPRWHANTVT